MYPMAPTSTSSARRLAVLQGHVTARSPVLSSPSLEGWNPLAASFLSCEDTQASLGGFDLKPHQRIRCFHEVQQGGEVQHEVGWRRGEDDADDLVGEGVHEWDWMSVEHGEVCGIIATVGEDDISNHLIEGLIMLQNRGYDSAGICTISPSHELIVTKFASSQATNDAIRRLESAVDVHKNHTIGIAHTRWATHGARTDLNAHPHLDVKNRIALVHNGVIENADEIRKMLRSHGIKCISETDTETISQLIGYFLDQGLEFIDAVRETQLHLEGTYGLAIIHRDFPTTIVAVKNGSPLLVGFSDTRIFVASEVSAFSRHTKDYVPLENGEIMVVDLKDRSTNIIERMQRAEHVGVESSPAPFPFWTIREIYEQPESLSRALNYGGRLDSFDRVKLGGLDEMREALLNIQHLVVTGCGTSLFAAQFGVKLMRRYCDFLSVTAIDASEVSADCFPSSGGGLLAISQSGETKDVERCLRIAMAEDISVFSVVNVVGSQVARATRCGVYLNSGREVAVASTKAFTSQTLVLALIACWFSQNRNLSKQKRGDLLTAVSRIPTCAGIALKQHERIKDVARVIVDHDHMFCLGKGLCEPIAYEAALKIKEITYIHAEGYSGGALKHGPFALLQKGTPIILFIMDDEHAKLMLVAAEEVSARGAQTIIVTNNVDIIPSNLKPLAVIPIPSAGELTPIIGIIPIQLLAFEISLLRGINPDFPRNLAKTVTTD